MRKRMLAVLLSVVMVLGMLPATASAGEGENPVYLALGDSITTGYAPPLADGTTQKVESPFADQVAAAQGYELTNLAKDGETSASLLAKLQETTSDELAAVTSTDLITITIGGNDLMGALYAYLAEEYVKENPSVQGFDADAAKALLMSGDPAFLAFAVEKISGGGFIATIITTLGTFSTNLTGIITAIKQENSNATILVATQYNPYYYLAKSTEGTPFADTASKISSAFETGLAFLNNAINSGASAGYQVVDVYQTFKKAVDDTPAVNPCNASMSTLDFHPNQNGHDLIAEAINGKLPEKEYSIEILGEKITSRTANDVLNDGTVCYNAATKTLTLNNADLKGEDDVIKSYGSSDVICTIEIIGENKISVSGDRSEAIYCSGTLILKGSGSLDISSEGYGGIYTRNLIITSGKYTFYTANQWWDIHLHDNNNRGKLEIRGEDTEITFSPLSSGAAVGGYCDIVLKDAKIKHINNLSSLDNGNIKIDNCEISEIFRIRTDGEVRIIDSNLTFLDTQYEAISGGAGVTVNGGNLNVRSIAGDDAIAVGSKEGDVSVVNGARLTVSSNGSAGISAGGDVIIEGKETVVDVHALGYGANEEGSIGIHSVGRILIKNSAVVRASGTYLDIGSDYESVEDENAPINISNSWVETFNNSSEYAIDDSVFFKGTEGMVYGNAAVPQNTEISEGKTLTVPERNVLTVPDDIAFTNNGALDVKGTLEIGSAATFAGSADVSGTVYVLETESGANPADGATLTLKSGGEVYAQLTELEGTTITPASRTSGEYSYTPAGSAESVNFVNRWSYYSGSSSSGTTTYTSTAETTENGTVAISPKNASKGTEVTVTVTPDEGYVLESLTVTDKNGTEIELTDQGDGKYSFTMPASNVKVDAVFAEEEPASTLPFSDVASDDWFCEAVQYVFDNGMMNGVGNDLFAPDSNLTRGMIAQVLYNLEGTPEAGSDAFTDVEAGQWYADAVNWAAANDIVSGYGDDTFGPQNDITREQMAQILYNYAVFKGYDVSVQGDLSAFSDGTATSDWALPAVKWAVGSGLLQGYAGRLNPAGTATRAEVAQILMNFCENIVMK